ARPNDFQMAANGARDHSLRRSLVPSIFIVLTRCRRALEERGLAADHTTIWRRVQRYGPELQQRLRRYLKSTNKSSRLGEASVRVTNHWCYLYRAIDSAGSTIDFLLSAGRDAHAAKRLFRKALNDPSHPQPRVINTDLPPIYTSAIQAIK